MTYYLGKADTPQEEFLRLRRWMTAEYYRLGELGLFDGDNVASLSAPKSTIAVSDLFLLVPAL